MNTETYIFPYRSAAHFGVNFTSATTDVVLNVQWTRKCTSVAYPSPQRLPLGVEHFLDSFAYIINCGAIYRTCRGVYHPVLRHYCVRTTATRACIYRGPLRKNVYYRNRKSDHSPRPAADNFRFPGTISDISYRGAWYSRFTIVLFKIRAW